MRQQYYTTWMYENTFLCGKIFDSKIKKNLLTLCKNDLNNLFP